MNGLYPLMISQFNQNKKDFNLLLKKSILIMLGLSVLGVITTLVFAPLVIQLVGGQNGFTGSTLSLRILSLGLPAFFVSSVLMWVLVTMKSYKTMLITYLVGLSANIILNLILVPQFSYIASSWITVFSEYLILILQLIILFPRLKQ
jgi:O-antigen/teichoic acid export membrane protein